MVFITRHLPGNPAIRSDADELLHGGLWPLTASAVAAVMAAAVLWFDLPVPLVLAWVALVTLSHGAAIALWRVRSRAPNPAALAPWLTRLDLNALAIAIAWGTVAAAIAAGAGNASQAVIYTAAVAVMAAEPVTAVSAGTPALPATLLPVTVSAAM